MVVTAANGRETLFVAREQKPDLIILDLMMPEMNGWEFMRLHRAKQNTPIIMLSARVEDMNMVAGLEMGADDYITKPFSLRELVARVRAGIASDRNGRFPHKNSPLRRSRTEQRFAHR